MKKRDKRGALEKFIDNYHSRQTFVFVVLDNEDRASAIKDRLVQTPSKYADRTITTEELIHLWDKSVEFDNFDHEEIAQAMTELCGGSYSFSAAEVAGCEGQFGAQGDPLNRLYKEKVGHELNKPKLLEVLCGFILANPDEEMDTEDEDKRPPMRVLEKVVELARTNYQPVTKDIQEWNQESGYLGHPLT